MLAGSARRLIAGGAFSLLWAVAGSAAAQDPAPAAPRRPSPWSGSVGANVSMYFGNNPQRLLGGRLALAHRDSALEFSGEVRGLYGEATIGDQPSQVTKRLWWSTLSMDVRPHDPTTLFVLGTMESSLEKRIARRYSAGAGVKQSFVRTDISELSLSGAILDEHTVPMPGVVSTATDRLTRWSWRGRGRHRFNDRLSVSHTTFWQPRFTSLHPFLVNTSTEIEFLMVRSVTATFSFLDSYDSDAVRRGARAYHDGQLLFGVTARW